MKRLLMLLTTFCLLLMTTALAETEAEWNAKCEWKTGTGTTLYAVTQGTATSSDLSDFVPVGTLPANTYVGILERSGNMRNVRYWNGSGTSSGWVDSAALVWVGSNSSKPKPRDCQRFVPQARRHLEQLDRHLFRWRRGADGIAPNTGCRHERNLHGWRVPARADRFPLVGNGGG